MQCASMQLGFSSSALHVYISASFDLPISLNIFPRLQYASKELGLSSSALRVDISASCKLPISLNMPPRLECAIA